MLVVCIMMVCAIASELAAQGLPAPQSRFVVVIDAAHGGDDAGGRLTSGQPEKTLTLAFSGRLRSLLSARGIQVVPTRNSDATVAPDLRAEIANRSAAQACLSLHASESGTGIHLFVSSLAPVEARHFVAWKTAQAASVSRSLALAGVLNSALIHAGLNVTLARTSLPGIDSMTCPAVAIELAPAQGANKKIATDIDDPDYQANVAAALAAAIVQWRDETNQGARQP